MLRSKGGACINHVLGQHLCRVQFLGCIREINLVLVVLIDIEFCIVENLTACFQIGFMDKELIVPGLVCDVDLIGVWISIVFATGYHGAAILYNLFVRTDGGRILYIFSISVLWKQDLCQNIAVRVCGSRSGIGIKLGYGIGIGSCAISVIKAVNGIYSFIFGLGINDLLAVIDFFDLVIGKGL